VRTIGSWQWEDLDAARGPGDWVEDATERLWLNPQLPPHAARARCRLGVQLLAWFDDLARWKEGLLVIGDFFASDSVLAAVAWSGGATRLLVYTATWQPVVRERYLAIRALLRPTPMGLRVAMDPAWKALIDLQAGVVDTALGADLPSAAEWEGRAICGGSAQGTAP
jgi:hypothetical protein